MINQMTVETLRAKLQELDNGVLYHGGHKAGTHEFCALEFARAVRRLSHSDQPTHLPDLRPLNDGPWSSDEARTEALLPVMAALWDWQAWSPARQRGWAKQVVIETVRQVIGEQLPAKLHANCCAVTAMAAVAAWAYVAAAAEAARAAAEAAEDTVTAGAADAVLQRACQIWVAAAQE
jgi:hypothetical protein